MDEDINKKANQDINLKSMLAIDKLLMLQKLLKDLSIKKKSLKEIKEEIFSEIDENSYKYFEGVINNKKAFDFILNQDTKINNKYILIQDNKKVLEDLYQSVYNFYFLLLNDNSLMLQLSELSQANIDFCEKLSDFFVHFLYTNMIDSSFNEERLILMIFLHLEKQILKVFKGKYLEEPFLINVFHALTRKIDIWNYLGSLLNKIILKIEKERTVLSVDINEVNKNLFLKGNNSNNGNYILDEIGKINDIQNSIITFEKRKTDETEQKEDEQNNKKKILNKKEMNIWAFFKDNDITKQKLIEILNKFKNIDENSHKNKAMEDYLNNLLKELDDSGKNKKEDKEIYSSYFIEEDLKSLGLNENCFNALMKNIYKNYNIIISTINNIIISISKNIESLPYSIKCIFKIINILLNKKYSNNSKYLKK